MMHGQKNIKLCFIFVRVHVYSWAGIATRYGLDGPGIESWGGGEIYRTCLDQPWGPPSLLYNGYGGLSRE